MSRSTCCLLSIISSCRWLLSLWVKRMCFFCWWKRTESLFVFYSNSSIQPTRYGMDSITSNQSESITCWYDCFVSKQWFAIVKENDCWIEKQNIIQKVRNDFHESNLSKRLCFTSPSKESLQQKALAIPLSTRSRSRSWCWSFDRHKQ